MYLLTHVGTLTKKTGDVPTKSGSTPTYPKNGQKPSFLQTRFL